MAAPDVEEQIRTHTLSWHNHPPNISAVAVAAVAAAVSHLLACLDWLAAALLHLLGHVLALHAAAGAGNVLAGHVSAALQQQQQQQQGGVTPVRELGVGQQLMAGTATDMDAMLQLPCCLHQPSTAALSSA
jgi:hypothetical protein